MEDPMIRSNLLFDWQPFGARLAFSWRDQYGTEGPDTIVGDWSKAPAFRSPADIGGLNIYAGGDHDIVYAGFGDDKVWGGWGNDKLYGEGGADTLYGEDGGDMLNGGLGADVMSGGRDNDVYFVDNAGDKVIEAVGEGWDTVQSSLYSYQLTANVETLYLIGAAVEGHGNADRNIISGNSGNNYLSGHDGHDELHGSFGEDTIDGGIGNDVIVGGGDRDVLYGGSGDDTFRFGTQDTGSHAGTSDVILDFTRPTAFGMESDQIDLTHIDANVTARGHQNFVFVGELAGGVTFTSPGQVGFRRDAFTLDFHIELNTDFDTQAEAVITVSFTGQEDPNANWFL
jgi:Ca2+-binding RTX toxin-like protein